ncbi:TetR family transcriptional regulator [Microbacterium sp. X-17]|uniref:TetR/AcrR family transcriptional regulator n=1 Tax=Microbacterium sp. X-17 TaxID=3144404 RepID=UPI0031F52B3D
MTAPAPATARKRPKDRKDQISRAASTLFRSRGYHDVSIADIASEVGITPGAVYRHFSSKDELLFQVVSAGLGRFVQLAEDATDLDEYLRASGRLALEHRALASLWMREARHLSEERGALLRRKLTGIAERLAVLLHEERPELAADDAELLAWALLAVFASFDMHRIAVAQRDFLQLYLRFTRVIVQCPMPGGTQVHTEPVATPTTPIVGMPRREQLLAEATRLFSRHGFNSVSMAEIGAATGITGSTIYKHFESKQDLLAAAIARAIEQLQANMARAMASGTTPEQALDRLLRSQVEFSLTERHVVEVLISELAELPEKERRAVAVAQRQYADVWVRLIAAVRPDLEPAAVKITGETISSIISNLVRTDRLVTRGDLEDRILDICDAALHLPADPER